MRTYGNQREGRVAEVQLLPRELLVSTGPVDRADWNYSGLLGAVQRVRFRLVSQLLGVSHFDKLLEVGYGSGVFAPELANRSGLYHGIDIHEHAEAVAELLHSLGIQSVLRRASVTEIPFEDGTFDCVICISLFEFVDDQGIACAEIRRVLKSDGFLLVATPGHSSLLDFGLKLLTGESARKHFGGRRESLMPALMEQFEIVELRDFPPLSPPGMYMYRALKLRKRQRSTTDASDGATPPVSG